MIKITSISQAPAIADQFDFHVSILDTRMKKSWKHNFGPNHITVFFEDTEHPDPDEWTDMWRGVTDILKWAVDKRLTLDDKLLVHCHAGVSRSSAIAWLLMVQMGVDQREAFEYLFSHRPMIWPNVVVMSMGDTQMKKGGELYKFATIINGEIAQRRQSSGYM